MAIDPRQIPTVHGSYAAAIERLAAEFEAKSARIARLAAKATEKKLGSFLAVVNRSPRPGIDAGVRRASVELIQDLGMIHVEAFGPGSIYERLATRTLVQAARIGDAKAAEGLSAAGESFRVIQAAVLDRDAIRFVAEDGFALASRNLTTGAVDEVRRLVTEELIQGNGAEVLRQRLIKSGLIPDLEVAGRTMTAETRAAQIARTEPRRVAEAVYSETNRAVEPNPHNQLYKWISILSPTSGKDSLRRHGLIMTRPEWETHDFGDGFYGLPPIRPNDNCSKIFYRRAWLTAEDQKFLATEPGQESRRLVSQTDETERRKLLEPSRRAA